MRNQRSRSNVLKSFLFVVILVNVLMGCSSPQPKILPTETAAIPVKEHAQSELDIFKANLVPSFRNALAGFGGATQYKIDLNIGNDIASISGYQEVLYTDNEEVPLEEIYFRMFPNMSGDYLEVKNIKVDDQSVDFEMEFENTALRVVLPEPLSPGDTVNLSMEFLLQVPSEMGGNYGLYVYLDEILALDAFFPIIPVYNSEGWNVEDPPRNADMIFTDAAFFEVTVTAPEGLVLVASGVQSDSKKENGRQVKVFRAGPQRDFYLAASSRFTSQKKKIDDTLVTSFFPEEYEEMGTMVLDTAVKSLQIFSDRYGEYPYAELDVVSTPMQAGGMEYSGAAAMPLNFYESGASINGVPGGVYLESSTAHEVAHQWFFNQVMNDQLDEPWLDEGFAQFLTSIYYLDTYSEAAAASYRESWDGRWARLGYEEIPVGKPAGEYEREEYSPIIYGRAPIFIWELEQEMGVNTFNDFLMEYIDTYRWQNVDTGLFKKMAEDYCHCDLTPLFDEWWAVN